MQSLTGKHILLGITGGIAAYKSAVLARRLMDAGAEVRVVMTDSAQAFITPLTLQALTGNPVHTSLLDEAAEAAMGHIELARWADLVLIAPATANTLARLAQGMADDLLTTLCLATEAPLCIAPAMNHMMWKHSATQANCDILKARGVTFLGPDSGDQACGETGSGRMMEPEAIRDALINDTKANADTRGSMVGKHVLITAGPTREPIDPVRFLSNRSSGKMGYAVASAAIEQGATVTLVSGPVNLTTPVGVQRIDVKTAAQMYDTVMGEIEHCDVFISVAAVADYRLSEVATQKIKKSEDNLTLTLTRNPDILKSVAALPNAPYCVGFAAETEKVEEHARGKLSRKKLDLIVANQVGQKDNPVFGSDTSAIDVYWGESGHQSVPPGTKTQLATELVDIIASRLSPN
ncbi:MAG: bifunctional phosphopantothenoylcysteine decarboxylase/phosphopantothenate--cysteine ligase CoaBC [Gammaproteobacteria bacterium]|nr:bifunctional phosphopantothenoylcysteine decarboxylase/phosphopantothenate--cysteine ligase CoaBC [Gammaproteobacteria bacterium]